MQNIKKFLSEAQMLKRLEHIGFKLAGVGNPDTLAEHALISAQIAFILAELEGADSLKAAAICIFHDNHEARTGDHNKVSARYINTNEAEKEAEIEQLKNLPENIASKVGSLLDEKRNRDTLEGIIAQDADWLEVAIQAKVFIEQGYKGCEDWIKNVEAALETESAKKILLSIKEDVDFTNSWWQGLKKMTYKKLTD
jgi:putative hydrolase of HD superfamily